MEKDLNMSSGISSRRNIWFGLFTFCVLGMFLVPIPYIVLDLFLALSIAVSLLVLFVAMNLRKPLEFNVFPSVLLFVTLFRLALSVAATRLILMDGPDFSGRIIETLGSLLLFGSPVVGLLIFGLIFIVQMKVVTAGASRIAEVSARFILDALPGKQLAIASDLNSGTINEHEAARRRSELNQQADFYGAMDGAFRFVRGDAIANIFVAIVSLVGGLLVGIFYNKMSLGNAFGVYSVLTIGNGLASLIASLVVSVASGLIMTKASSNEGLSVDLKQQLFIKPKALQWTSVILLMFIVFGMPVVPFLVLSISTFVLGVVLERKQFGEEANASRLVVASAANELKAGKAKTLTYIPAEAIEVELGLRLISIADREGTPHSDLRDGLAEIRRKIAEQTGLIIPNIRVRDNLELPHTTYVIKIRGNQIASGELEIDKPCISEKNDELDTVQKVSLHPVFSFQDWYWISPFDQDKALSFGFEVMSASDVLLKHLAYVLKRHIHELLTRQEVRQMLDQLRATMPAVVDEVVPEIVDVGLLHRIMKNLLQNGIPIRDLVTIIETLAEHKEKSSDVDVLTDLVRQSLNRSISNRYRDKSGYMRVLSLDPAIEERIMQFISAQNVGVSDELKQIARQLKEQVRQMYHYDETPVLLCRASARRSVQQMIERVAPELVVLSIDEISPETELEAKGVSLI